MNEETIERIIEETVEDDAFGLHNVDEAAAEIANRCEEELAILETLWVKRCAERDVQLAEMQTALEFYACEDNWKDFTPGCWKKVKNILYRCNIHGYEVAQKALSALPNNKHKSQGRPNTPLV